MQAAGAVVSLSPSFNSYSNSTLAEIAARVVEELRAEGNCDEFCDEFYFERKFDLESVEKGGEEYGDEDEEFEFEFVTKDSESSPISADEIFHNGKIRPVYPIFGSSDLLLRNTRNENEGRKENGTKTIRRPLRKLFIEERETATTSSSSSSDADELDGVPSETYCVWRPKSTAPAVETEGRCKKSSSTGSIYKRWKLKDLLHRSHSEGNKDGFVFLTPSNSGRKRETKEKIKETARGTGKPKPSAPPPPPLPPSQHNRDAGEKRRTYLPYRQDLVGLFSNVNALSKNLQHF